MKQKIVPMEYSWKYSEVEPYSWMVNDLWRGIHAEQNYLVALGLFAYSEALGRMILKTVGDDRKGQGVRAYKHFTKKFVSYNFKGKEWDSIYHYFRNGLAHEFYIKKRGSGVTNHQVPTLACGINISGNTFSVEIHSYFLHFVGGLEKALDQNQLPINDPVFLTSTTSSQGPSITILESPNQSPSP